MESFQLDDIRKCETKLCGNMKSSALPVRLSSVERNTMNRKNKQTTVYHKEMIELHTVDMSWIEPIKTRESRYNEMIKKMNEQFIECSISNI